MDIFKLDNDKVRVCLEKSDLNKMGITFADFSTRDSKAELFLQKLLGLIYKAKLVDISDGSVELDVTESAEGELDIYMRFVGSRKPPLTELCYITDSHVKLISFARKIMTQYGGRIKNDKLYTLSGMLALRFEVRYARSTAARKENLKECCNDRVTINKIAEYGELVSTSPLEKLFAIS